MNISNIRFFHMDDNPNAKTKPCIEIPFSACREWNEKNHGIFWTWNEFNGPRKKENLKKINVWAVDIDQGTKQEQAKRIREGLIPSLVIETKRGYQVYFVADGAEAKYFKHIMKDRLIPFYNGDPNAGDVSRVLRVHSFYHCKDPNDKFLVKKVFERSKSIYSQKIICAHYPDVNAQARKQFEESTKEIKLEYKGNGNFWEEIFHMDQMAALQVLSGTPAVNGERFTFRKVSRGHFNIFVDGKGTSCFIDSHRKIGSLTSGGPSLANWLYWYHRDWNVVINYMKEYFPELF